MADQLAPLPARTACGPDVPLARGTPILEHDAGLPRAWAEGVARLLAGLPPPRGCTPRRWAQVCADAAGLVAGGWARQAAALGWDVAGLFGAMPGYPVARYDAQGLAWLLCGQPVLDLDAGGAAIRTPSGGALRFYRRPASDRAPPASVPAWDLAAAAADARRDDQAQACPSHTPADSTHERNTA